MTTDYKPLSARLPDFEAAAKRTIESGDPMKASRGRALLALLPTLESYCHAETDRDEDPATSLWGILHAFAVTLAAFADACSKPGQERATIRESAAEIQQLALAELARRQKARP